MLNKYVNRSRISEAKFREIVKLFSIDLEADQTAQITGLSRNTINRYYKAFRERIVQICEHDSPFSGEIEVDESYFGARRIKGKRGRGAYGKAIVFGLLKREGKVYTENGIYSVLDNCKLLGSPTICVPKYPTSWIIQ